MTDNASGACLLAGRNLSVRFGGVKAVSDVTIELEPAEACGLIGPNGAGKTTLFDTLAGLRSPSAGTIELDGVDITRRSATWRSRQGLRRTFQRQQPFGLLSVEDNVLVATEWRGGGGGAVGDLLNLPSRNRRERERRKRVAEVMELCGIHDQRHQPAGQLPIGTLRMVEMARAIVDHPRVLLLDEPTSGLDEREVDRFAEALHRVRRAEKCGVLLVEHNIGFVMDNCERIVVLNLGQVLAEGPPDVIRTNVAVAEAYLG